MLANLDIPHSSEKSETQAGNLTSFFQISNKNQNLIVIFVHFVKAISLNFHMKAMSCNEQAKHMTAC